MKEALVLDGWPGPLRPVLDPREGVVVDLRAEPRKDLAPTAKCVLPPHGPVSWSRSRVRVERQGVLRAKSDVSLSSTPISSLEGLRPAHVAGFGPDLALKSGEGRVMAARFGGRCLLREGSGWQAADCSKSRVEVLHEPEQGWWLEVGCSTGEGWFEVDETAFEIEHYLD